MTLHGGASDETVAATDHLDGRLGLAMSRSLDAYLGRVLQGLAGQVSAAVRAGRYADDGPPAKVGNPGLVAGEDDWYAAMAAGQVGVVLGAGYEDLAGAVAGSELPAGIVVEADVAAAVDAHVASIRAWAAPFRADVARIVSAGVADGLSSKTIGEHLAANVLGVDGRRGLTIARTESNAAQNAGRTVVHDATGERYMRAWLATPDARVRLTHGEAHNQVRAKGQPFAIGGWLCDYPGDTNLPAGERVHCRCSTVISYSGWTPAELEQDQSEWRQRVKDLAAEDGLPLGPELAALVGELAGTLAP